MNLTLGLDQKNNICESLFGILLPSFYASLKLTGFSGFQDLIAHLNESVTATTTSNSAANTTNNQTPWTNDLNNNNINKMLTHPCDITSNSLSPSSPSSSLRCSLLQSYTLDLANYFQFCTQIESNLVYFDWLFGLFQPLILALCSLFLLPAIIVFFLYVSSLFLFLTKHWSKLKVSLFHFFKSFTNLLISLSFFVYIFRLLLFYFCF